MVRDLIALSDQSRVWVYQVNRELSDDELEKVRPLIYDFLEQWTAHDQHLLAYGNIFHRRFLALFVDESKYAASGCSIDKSVKFIETLGRTIGVDFFDRMSACYLRFDQIHSVKLSDLKLLYHNGVIDGTTLFFDHLVKTKKDFIESWLVRLDQSWYKRFL